MYKKALLHFKKTSPSLYEASLEFEIEDIQPSKHLFRDIVWTIIGQQLSGKAADTIFGRFELLFPKKLITAKRILDTKDTHMRKAGLSDAKSRAIKDLAEKIVSGEIRIEHLPSLKDEDVMNVLTKVKGIGPWTVQMLLMFSLGRTDVFSMGDLVLKKEIMNLHGWKKPPSEKQLKKVLDSWSPYKTYAAKILWKIADKKKKKS